MIELNALTIGYGSRRILQNYTLKLKRGKILAILCQHYWKTTFMSAPISAGIFTTILRRLHVKRG